MSVPFGDSAYLLKVTAFNQPAMDTMDGPPFPGGELDDLNFFTMSPWGAASIFYPAATIGRSTAPTDTPANTYVPAAFTGTFNYSISLFGGTDPSQAGQSSVGVLELIDTGFLDGLTRRVWDGATVELLRGDRDALFSTYSTVAKLSTAGIVWDTRKKELRLRDLSQALTGPLHGTRYAGTTGYEGDSTLAGRIRPIAYGQVFNITPVQVNSTTLIYEVSCTSVQAITAVREAGSALALDTSVGTSGDFATYALLAAAVIAAGKYVTCKALGLFRLQAAPLKAITADVQGDADTIGGATYTAKRAGIMRRIAVGRGNLKLTTSQIDDSTFTAMDTAQAGTCGYYFDAEVTKAEALAEVAAGCLGYWWFTIAGLLSVGYLTEVAATADYTLTVPLSGQATGTGDVIGEPTTQEPSIPRQSTLGGWSFNYTVQPQTELAGAVTQANVAIYSADMRTAPSSSATLARIWPNSPIIRLNTGLAGSSDSQTEATRQQALLGVPRVRWSVRVRLDPFGNWLGKTFSVNGWQRFGFAGAKRFLCVGVSVQGRNEVVLDLWGAL